MRRPWSKGAASVRDSVIVPQEHDFAHWRIALGWTYGGGGVALTHWGLMRQQAASRSGVQPGFDATSRASTDAQRRTCRTPVTSRIRGAKLPELPELPELSPA